MRATNPSRRTRRHPGGRQSGVAAIEFTLLAVVFFSFVFGIIEVSRLLFVYNTLQEVTRRAAAAAVDVYPSDTAAIAKVKQDAVFRNSPGELVLAPPITDQHIRLEYLKFDLSVIPEAAWPASAAANRATCMADPHASNCIRFVRASICDLDSTGTCNAVRSAMLFPLIDLRVPLHRAITIAPVESLGYVLGTPAPPLPPPCSC
jgi:TadE-like protein